MQKLRLKRYTQEPGHCAIAASATLANYHNPAVDYDLAKRLVRKYVTRDLGQGLWTGQTGRLLNCLGFKKVTVVSADLDYFDFSWSRLSRKNVVKKLKKVWKAHSSSRRSTQEFIEFLEETDCQNRLIVDNNFQKYIKEYIDYGYPVGVAFNWTMFFKYAKYDADEKPNSVHGDYECHLVCCSGYTRTGVYLVDSHHNYYKYRLAKYRKGEYHVRWENLFNSMGMHGEIYLPENYDPSSVMI